MYLREGAARGCLPSALVMLAFRLRVSFQKLRKKIDNWAARHLCPRALMRMGEFLLAGDIGVERERGRVCSITGRMWLRSILACSNL